MSDPSSWQRRPRTAPRAYASPIRILTLGAGQDIGRSCVVVTLAGKRIMFDCGMHMGYSDDRRYPAWSALGAAEGATLSGVIDCVVVTHFHLDHCGALPYLTERLGFDGPVYMTAPTAAIAAVLLKDYLHVLVDRKGEKTSYTPADVDACMRKVTIVALGEAIAVDDELTLTTHYAGHVLGAVMCAARVRAEAPPTEAPMRASSRADAHDVPHTAPLRRAAGSPPSAPASASCTPVTSTRRQTAISARRGSADSTRTC
jgi:predicted metal-dependent RNase